MYYECAQVCHTEIFRNFMRHKMFPSTQQHVVNLKTKHPEIGMCLGYIKITLKYRLLISEHVQQVQQVQQQ